MLRLAVDNTVKTKEKKIQENKDNKDNTVTYRKALAMVFFFSIAGTEDKIAVAYLRGCINKALAKGNSEVNLENSKAFITFMPEWMRINVSRIDIQYNHLLSSMGVDVTIEQIDRMEKSV